VTPPCPPISCCIANMSHPDARRYFKQSEIILYRQTPEIVANGADGLPLPRKDEITSVPA